MGRSEEQIAAYEAVEDAKNMIKGEGGAKDFKSAVTKIKEAIKIYPKLRNGQKMLTVCEILHMSTTFKPRPKQERWPYALLQIPSSSSASKVKSRYRQFMDEMKTYKTGFPSVSVAIKFLENTMYVYNRKLNLDDENDDDDDDDEDDDDQEEEDKKKDDDNEEEEEEEEEEDEEEEEEEEEEEGNKSENSTADDGTGDDRDDEDARSPVCKKLRREIFTALPQNPDLFSKYYPRIREQMKEVFDVTFVKLSQEIQNLSVTLSLEQEDNIRGELSNLEEMGYDVKKFIERFDSLVELAHKDREMEKELEAINHNEMVQLGVAQSRISELQKAKESSKTQLIALKSEIAALKSKVDKQGGLRSVLDKFRSVGMNI